MNRTGFPSSDVESDEQMVASQEGHLLANGSRRTVDGRHGWDSYARAKSAPQSGPNHTPNAHKEMDGGFGFDEDFPDDSDTEDNPYDHNLDIEGCRHMSDDDIRSV